MKASSTPFQGLTTHRFPSPYGEWRVTEGGAPADLVTDIESYWESQGTVAFEFEKLVPRGNVDLIFNLAGPQAMYSGKERHCMPLFKRAWVSGLFDRPLYVGPAYDAGLLGTHLVGVSISPWAVYSLFGIDAHELRNSVIEAEELFGAAVNRTWNRIGEAESAEERYDVVMSFVRQCRRRLSRTAPFSAVWAARKTQSQTGVIQVQNLCSELGISRKHLGAMFKRMLGMSPKSYARLERFRAGLAMLQTGEHSSPAAVAAELGFTDQGHFSRDFKAFTGEPPGSFLRSVSSDGESTLFADDR